MSTDSVEFTTFKNAPYAFTTVSKKNLFCNKQVERLEQLTKKYRKIKIKYKKYSRRSLKQIKLSDYFNTINNKKYNSVFKLDFKNPDYHQILPIEIILLIGNYNPKDIRTLGKELYIKIDPIFCINNKLKLTNYCFYKYYLSSIGIKPNFTALNLYYLKKKYNNNVKTPCNCITKKGTFCKILTYGNKKCGHHKSKGYIPMNGLPYSSEMELRIDTSEEHSGFYTQQQFYLYYGNLNKWYESQIYLPDNQWY